MGLADLFRPKWKHSSPDVRRAAVAGISDESMLAGIARDDAAETVRAAAHTRLADLANSGNKLAETLYLCVEEGVPFAPCGFCRGSGVIDRIEDSPGSELPGDTGFSEPGSTSHDEEVCRWCGGSGSTHTAEREDRFERSAEFRARLCSARMKAVREGRLSREALLWTPGWTEGRGDAMLRELRLKWVESLEDEAERAEIAKTSKDREVSVAAVRGLTNQALLAAVARTWGCDSTVKEVAVGRITSGDILVDLVRDRSLWGVRSAALESPHLKDQALLAETVRGAERPSDRHGAVANPNFCDQALLTEIATHDAEWYVRTAAIEKLTERAVIARIAKNDRHWIVRREAEKRLAQIPVHPEEPGLPEA